MIWQKFTAIERVSRINVVSLDVSQRATATYCTPRLSCGLLLVAKTHASHAEMSASTACRVRSRAPVRVAVTAGVITESHLLIDMRLKSGIQSQPAARAQGLVMNSKFDIIIFINSLCRHRTPFSRVLQVIGLREKTLSTPSI